MSRTPTFLGALAVAGAVLAASATHAQAQTQDFTWTEDRPDGVTPAGLYATRILPEGAFQIMPTFRRFDRSGLRLGTDFVTTDELFAFFDQVPFAMSVETVMLNASYGASENVTLLARIGYVDKGRDVLTNDDVFFSLENDDVTDLELQGLWEIYSAGAWKAHLHGGISIPLTEPDADETVPGIRAGTLPYDLQIGSGVFGFIPGLTVQTMNEHGSVGFQVQGRVYVDENDQNWRPGDSVEGNLWAQYRINDFISISSGVRGQSWGAISGFDPSLDPQRDPGELASSFEGERVDIPLGLNLLLPEGPLAGHRLGVDFFWNVHEDVEGPLLAADDGWVLSWTKTF